MKRNSLADLVNAVGQIDVISTDVFDTLLLRTSRSERSRIVKGERLFSDLLARHGWHIKADFLADTRFQAQRLAFRELSVRGRAGEVRLVDIISRQLSMLGLPSSLLAERLRIEVQIEKASLVANEPLANILRAHRRAGTRIVAVSDTTLPSEAVSELIQHFHGPDLIDRVYSSADHGLTKRDGDLFPAVAQAENVSPEKMAHIGDDFLADVQAPSAKGIAAYHTPRRPYHRYVRSANGALTEAGRFARRRARAAKATTSSFDNANLFGRYVLGPIVTQFCLLAWLYAVEAEASDKAVLLFCARGGVGIREAFERVLAKLCLPLGMRRENIMISRLVAARAALLTRSDSVVEELDREFRGGVLADVAKALGGRTYELPEIWRRPFSAQQFVTLLFGSSGAEVLADIEKQNALFTRHFRQLVGDADRIILCDTGLYGSTQRLLASGFPEIRVETIQFARSNYKGHSEEHFPKVSGLVVEQNFYSPFNVCSCVLRYWHLVESLFEPAVPSVHLFTENELGQTEANCGDITFGAIDPSVGNHLLSGALAYIEALPANGGAIALQDAEIAWRRLKDAITQPTEAELRCLEVGGRSVDFGRSDVLRVVAPGQNMTFIRKLISVKSQLWREGAIAREFPFLKHALLPMLGSILSLRGLLARQHG
ncbi:HAD family hydrolase [Bradyrhizobium canariense]|uniref:Predicted hydrolase, HAD superfamily n=1 Tax=Bradyrhizobium canariense TaxID=255045 RepID=A0A1H2BJX9_9BRAD|nr:HAD family hydrolase [Bradyrhizobium canariense]SDT58342.1 Predicted hydrolase, HAD superfamily [Bradyrhizobium canariense]